MIGPYNRYDEPYRQNVLESFGKRKFLLRSNENIQTVSRLKTVGIYINCRFHTESVYCQNRLTETIIYRFPKIY